MATLAFLLLIMALVLFIVSTNQWALTLRGLVWGGGLLAIILGWIVLGNTQRDPELATAFGDFATKIFNPGDSMLVKMYASNSGTVGGLILSLFDIFQVMAVIVGIIALVAFTPGEQLERVLRPIMIGLIGAVFGGVLALAIVGTGFGEGKERKSYAGKARLDTVFDGGTIMLNDTLLKLRGIQAPEPGQVCRRDKTVFDCANEAKSGLAQVIEGAFLNCLPEGTVAEKKTVSRAESRTVSCLAVRSEGSGFDVASRLVEQGWALDTSGAFAMEASRALAAGRGLYAFCSVRPDAWAKLSQKERTAFRDTGALPQGTATVGPCPVQKAPAKRPTVVRDEKVSRPQ